MCKMYRLLLIIIFLSLKQEIDWKIFTPNSVGKQFEKVFPGF